MEIYYNMIAVEIEMFNICSSSTGALKITPLYYGAWEIIDYDTFDDVTILQM